jgi:hypothetical protein
MGRNETMIAGLLREREVYETRGEGTRVALVDEQLAHYGYEPPQVPKGRAAPEEQKQTADADPGATAAPRSASTRKAR